MVNYRDKFQELDVELDDIIVCVSESSEMFTAGVEYVVTATEDGKLGVLTDCGFIATTTASLFTPLKLLNATEVMCLKADPLAPWSFPLATIVRKLDIELDETTVNDSNVTTIEEVTRAA